MLGKLLLTIDAVGLLFGAPMAEYNHTHMFNPRWTPHARFHGAWTMSLSVILGLGTLYYTWRPTLLPPSTPPSLAPLLARQLQKDSMCSALFTGTIYWLAGLASILYPGTDGVDPEFGPSGFPQRFIFAGFATAAALGSLIEGWL